MKIVCYHSITESIPTVTLLLQGTQGINKPNFTGSCGRVKDIRLEHKKSWSIERDMLNTRNKVHTYAYEKSYAVDTGHRYGIISRVDEDGVEIEYVPGGGNSNGNNMECRVTKGIVREKTGKKGWAQIIGASKARLRIRTLESFGVR